MPTRCATPVWIGISLRSWVYIRFGPTCLAPGQFGLVVLPVTLLGSRSMSGTTVVLVTNQSKSCPVQKSTTFMTTPACWASIVEAAYGAPDWVYVPVTTRPGSVPGVSAVMVDSNVTEPLAGTANALFDTPMYFRWSKTLKSAPIVKGAALTVSMPPAKDCVAPASNESRPYGIAHLAS